MRREQYGLLLAIGIGTACGNFTLTDDGLGGPGPITPMDGGLLDAEGGTRPPGQRTDGGTEPPRDCDLFRAGGVSAECVNENYGVFVALGAVEPFDGSRQHPYATFADALANIGDKGAIFATAGEYAEAVSIEGNISVFGGFSATFDAELARGRTILRPLPGSYALEVTGGGSELFYDDLDLYAADVSNVAGASSIAAFVHAVGGEGAPTWMRRVQFAAGAAGTGSGGGTGDCIAAGAAGEGAEFLFVGGKSATAGAPPRGGDAGRSTENCDDVTTGGNGTPGNPGSGTTPLDVRITLDDQGIATHVAGGVGANGEPGGSGGGGGVSTAPGLTGGRGGRGGKGACGGGGGLPGNSGGHSVGLLAFDVSDLRLQGARFEVAAAGGGGLGGPGGSPGEAEGGVAGGGSSCTKSGGAGASGGGGVGGSGGAGGSAVCLLHALPAKVDYGDSQCTGGALGPAGTGGQPGGPQGRAGVRLPHAEVVDGQLQRVE